MKKSPHLVIAALFILIVAACTTSSQTQPSQTAIEVSPTETQTVNQLFLDFLNTNNSEINEQSTIVCKTTYPNIQITQMTLNEPISYVVDQNPTTVSYNPTVTYNIDNSYSATAHEGKFTLLKAGVAITDTNIINMANSQGLIFSNISVYVELEFKDRVLIKSITCIIK